MQGIMNVIEMVNFYEELLYIVMFFCLFVVFFGSFVVFWGEAGYGEKSAILILNKVYLLGENLSVVQVCWWVSLVISRWLPFPTWEYRGKLKHGQERTGICE